MRRIRALLTAAALVAGVVAVPAHAATTPVQRLTLVLKRTTSGPSQYDLQVSVANDHTSGSFIGSVATRIERGRPVSASDPWANSARRWEDETLSVGGSRVLSTCDVGVCHDDRLNGVHGLGTTYSDDGGPSAPTHFFYAATGKKITIRFQAKGWKLIRVPFAFRWLDGGQTSPAHGHVGAFGGEVYTDGSLPGGRHGSLAVAVPPCSLAGVSLAMRGAGLLTLDGGAKSQSVLCPGLPTLLASYATKATKWRLHGTAAGESTNQDTRLFVVDLPARLP